MIYQVTMTKTLGLTGQPLTWHRFTSDRREVDAWRIECEDLGIKCRVTEISGGEQ